MKIGVLGTGGVGHTLATRFVDVGHQVMMGSRQSGNDRAVAWVTEVGSAGSEGSFADAAGFGELVVNATAGATSVEALAAAGSANLAGKVLMDVSNPLDLSRGFPPSLSVCNTDSTAEQIQRQLPETSVVKVFNTMNSDVMVNPAMLAGPHNAFLCGDDHGAKQKVMAILESFGWPASDIVDVGGIDGARGMEMYVVLWIRLMGILGGPHFNINVVRAR